MNGWRFGPRDRRAAVLLALGLLVYWLAWLGAAPLFDVDEGAFSEASREMLRSGDWLHTTLNGTDRFDKPILVYWLQAASLAVFGVHEFAARLPSALCGWGWSLAAGWFAAQRWGRGAGLAAAVVIATSAGPLFIGRAATADALLNLLLVLTLFDTVRFVELDVAGEREAALRKLRRAFLWAGLGLLAKGPVAVVVPAGALLGWAVLARGGAWRTVLRAAADWRAWCIALGVALPWYLYALHRHGRAFIDGFFLRHNLDRFSGPLEGHQGSVLYYLVVLPLVMLPWTPLLVPALRSLWREWRVRSAGPALLMLAGWGGFVLVFFSLSGTKLPHYVLYGLTPFALLSARALAGGSRWAAWLVAGLACAVVLLTTASPGFAVRLAQAQQDPYWRALVDPASLPPAPAWGLAVAVAFGVALAALWRFRRGDALGGTTLAALTCGLWLTSAVVPWWGETLHGPARQLSLLARERGLPLVQWRADQPSAAFYRDAPAPRRAPQPGEAALSREDRLGQPGPDVPARYDIVARSRGLVLITVPRAP
jgi:4-amino-4-deoxy-L-arabinose transferase-like glycosyltransferase